MAKVYHLAGLPSDRRTAEVTAADNGSINADGEKRSFLNSMAPEIRDRVVSPYPRNSEMGRLFPPAPLLSWRLPSDAVIRQMAFPDEALLSDGSMATCARIGGRIFAGYRGVVFLLASRKNDRPGCASARPFFFPAESALPAGQLSDPSVLGVCFTICPMGSHHRPRPFPETLREYTGQF